MKLVSAVAAGFIIQLTGLSAFILIARSGWASPGKQLVIVIVFILMTVLLAFANKPYVLQRSVILSALLALAYLVGYYVLGATLFPGLMKDLSILSVEDLQAVGSVFGTLFVLYVAGSAVLGLLQNAISRSNKAK